MIMISNFFSTNDDSRILAIDAAINFVLGILLLIFPSPLVDLLGVPTSPSAFYPSILGAVLTGIGIALVIQIASRERSGGLGLAGAIAVNLCGGFVLAAWLLCGKLEIPLRGYVFLWSLVVVLVGVSLLELMAKWTNE